MHSESVDLSLAVNYLPACICVAKSSVLIGALAAMHLFSFFPGYVALGMLLVSDRIQCPGKIFDGNSILLTLLLADIVYRLRETREDMWWHLWESIWHGGSVIWSMFAIYLITEHDKFIREPRERNAIFVATSILLVVISMCRGTEEPVVIRVARNFTFTLLSVLWCVLYMQCLSVFFPLKNAKNRVYIAGIHKRRMSSHKDSGVHFLINFGPVLFVHPYCAIVFAVISLSLCFTMLVPNTCSYHSLVSSSSSSSFSMQQHSDDDLESSNAMVAECDSKQCVVATGMSHTTSITTQLSSPAVANENAFHYNNHNHNPMMLQQQHSFHMTQQPPQPAQNNVESPQQPQSEFEEMFRMAKQMSSNKPLLSVPMTAAAAKPWG